MGNYNIHLGKTYITPEASGYSKTQLDILDQHYMKLMDADKLQCAGYLLAKDGKIFAHKSMGKLRGYEDKGDYKPDSIRKVASITKVITATAIMQLVEKGILYLSQPVSTILKEFDTSLHKDITLFHLLTHTSGLVGDPGTFFEPYPFGWWNGGDDCEYNWIKLTLAGRLHNEIGQVWDYNTAGFCILAEVVTHVTGILFEDYVKKNIFEPLGMNRSFFDIPENLRHEVCLVFEDEQDSMDKRDPYKHPAPGGFGMFSTLNDLFNFGQMMLNKGTFNGNRILGRKTVEYMTRNHLSDVPAYNWNSHIKAKQQGIGWCLASDNLVSIGTFDHEGAGASGLYIDPVENFIAVFFVPSRLNWIAENVFGTIEIVWSGIL